MPVMRTIAVVVHWGDSGATRNTVSSLLGDFSPSRIIVVENGMAWDGGNLPEEIIRVFLPQNLGYAGGVNTGMRAAFGRGAGAVLVLNNDLRFPVGALRIMEEKLLQAPSVGCVGAIMDEGDGYVIYGGGRVSWLTGRANLSRYPDPASRLHYISGACMLIRREAFEQIGPIPEQYFHTWEDTAWGSMLRQYGWNIAWANTPIVTHPRSHSLPDGQKKTYYLVRNGALFIRQHAPFFAKVWLLGIEPIRIVLAMLRGKGAVVRGLRDARAGIAGPLPVSQKHQPARVTGALCRVSVIIPTHQSEETIVQCLQSAERAIEQYGGNGEISVVDGGSTDDTVRVAKATGIPSSILRFSNIGFGGIANRAARRATGDIILFLNPDALLPPGALSSLVHAFLYDNVGIVGCRLISPEGELEHMQGAPYPSLARTVRKSFTGRCCAVGSQYSVPWVSGAAMAVRRNVFQSLKGFSERYFLYFEDVDLCRRARMKGWSVMVCSAVTVVHEKGKSTRHPQRKAMYDTAQNYYFQRYRPMWEYVALRFLRVFYRNGWAIGIVGIGSAAAFIPIVSGVGAVLTAIIALVAKFPVAGVGMLAVSLLAGQSVRIPVLGTSLTVTDSVFPVVVIGWLLAIMLRRRMGEMGVHLMSYWWVVVALLPGILLAVERLPFVELIASVSYAVRLGAVLLFIPLLRSLRISFYTVRLMLLSVAVFLVGIGIVQLLFLPSLPPLSETLVSKLLLTYSGGGWDPHEFRMFATWLDPNFLGGFFAIAIALVLPVIVSKDRIKNLYTVRYISFFILLVVLSASIALTKSRASIVAVFGAVTVLVAIMASKYKPSYMHARFLIPVASIAVLGILAVPGLAERFMASPEYDPTFALRVESWMQAVGHIEQYPWFGVGYNAYGAEQVASGNVTVTDIRSISAADNAMLTFFATTGIWGVVFLCGGLIWGLRNLLRCRNAEKVVSVLLLITAVGVHTQFMQSITYIHIIVPLALILGTVDSSRWGVRDA